MMLSGVVWTLLEADADASTIRGSRGVRIAHEPVNSGIASEVPSAAVHFQELGTWTEWARRKTPKASRIVISGRNACGMPSAITA
jgi:hypothetical protein